jgi:hypothetical protein
MTNIELQELLKQYPPETPVFFWGGDEMYHELETEDVKFKPGSEIIEEAIYL